MKRIIEITDEIYENLSKGYWSEVEFCDLANAIANSISFDKTIEDIEQEIKYGCNGLATNIDEPHDEHDIIFADEVLKILERNKENKQQNE